MLNKKIKQDKNSYSINETEFKIALGKILSSPNKPPAQKKKRDKRRVNKS